ncbi:hypothetical protein [Butyrivibrio proteoclasticus]|uniref:hypothetical protein n=1 Tax=Butyrivibrio proteoclasticus TaxID=43305 RepID=UPI0006886F46|nr:hypothetical protein [Butyrivibrio proteoclasticus]
MFDIEAVIEDLRKRRPVFVSEADFQLEFAWSIKRLYRDNYDIRLEYTPSDQALNEQSKMHIDILLKPTDTGKWIPIELKYKTKSCVLQHNGEIFDLANHGAKDIGCYLYLNDVQRIEKIKTVKQADYEKGYAVMLTNELSYTKPPRKNDCVYAAFCIDEGRIKHGTMGWSSAASAGTKKGIESDIVLDGSYLIKWKNYSELTDGKGKNVQFKYVVCEV